MLRLLPDNQSDISMFCLVGVSPLSLGHKKGKVCLLWTGDTGLWLVKLCPYWPLIGQSWHNPRLIVTWPRVMNMTCAAHLCPAHVSGTLTDIWPIRGRYCRNLTNKRVSSRTYVKDVTPCKAIHWSIHFMPLVKTLNILCFSAVKMFVNPCVRNPF